jgi:hypothetical protein
LDRDLTGATIWARERVFEALMDFYPPIGASLFGRNLKECEGNTLQLRSVSVKNEQAVAQIPFRSPKRIFDHSRVRFTANPKLAFQAQTLGLRPFRFTKNGYQNL